MKRKVTGWKGPAAAAVFFCLAATLMAFPIQVREGVKNSLLYCLTVLAPSLFPFMILTGFAVDSSAGEALGICLGPLCRFLFRLPECCAAPILMSFLGGYPAGARSVSLLLEQGKITKQQAGRMMLFCMAPGTAFVVTFLGGGVLGDLSAGWLLFFSVTLAGLLLGVLTGLRTPFPPKSRGNAGPMPPGALIRSVKGASQSVLTMCACVVAFSGFTVLLHSTGLFQLCCRGLSRFVGAADAPALLSFLLEVTGGAGVAAKFQAGPVLYAFGLAFGGLCVHLQVFSLFEELPLPRWKFFLFRLLHGGLAAGCCQLLSRLVPGGPRQALAQAGASESVLPFSSTLAGGLSLVLMCAAFLLAVTKDGESLA